MCNLSAVEKYCHETGNLGTKNIDKDIRRDINQHGLEKKNKYKDL